MSSAPEDPPSAPDAASAPKPAQAPNSAPEPEQDSGTKGDMIALGIGCAVFVVMFVAIVLVGMSGR
jgi:hypothetical protein